MHTHYPFKYLTMKICHFLFIALISLLHLNLKAAFSTVSNNAYNLCEIFAFQTVFNEANAQRPSVFQLPLYRLISKKQFHSFYNCTKNTYFVFTALYENIQKEGIRIR